MESEEKFMSRNDLRTKDYVKGFLLCALIGFGLGAICGWFVGEALKGLLIGGMIGAVVGEIVGAAWWFSKRG